MFLAGAAWSATPDPSAPVSSAANTNAPPAASPEPIERELHYTATRRGQRPLELPYVTEQIRRNAIRNEQMAASVPEALLETPGVMVQQTAHGQGSPYIRGFTGFRALMLVDGIRLNNSTFRDGPNQYWSTVDALAVERLELVKGPASVMYGSDAIGGAVNALMRAPGYGFSPGLKWSGATYYRFGSAERAHLGRAEFSGADLERWGFNLGLTGKTFGDVQGGNEVGRQPHTGYDQWDTDAKADYYFSPQTKLTLGYQRTQQYDVERTHRTIYGLTWHGLVAGTDLQHYFDQMRQLTYARLAHETERGDRFTGTVSWHRQDEFQFVQRANRTVQRTGVDVNTVGLSLQCESPSKIGTWVYGAEHYRDYVDSYQHNYNAAGAFTGAAIQGPVADNSLYDLLGVYVQDDIPLLDRLHFIVGGRFNWARADAGKLRDPQTGLQTSFTDSWNNLSGSGRLLWHPDESKRWSLYTGASQGFRAPNLSDLTRFDIARSGELETAALDLKPEKFLSLEAGVKTVQKNWEAGLAFYHTFIDDLIVRTPTGAIIGGNREVTKHNASQGWVHGVELRARGYLGQGFSLFGNLAWQEGEADAFPTSNARSVRAPLSRMQPLTGLTGLRWDSFRTGFFAETYGMMSAKQDRLSPDDVRDTQRIPPGGTPGWATLNFRVGYDWKGRVRAVAGLENVLDQDYRIHGSGYNQPGRNFKLSLEYRF
jgi:hemoglobin/transferrin/lactoferrin receptor protein